MEKTQSIGFLGAGNMGGAIIDGLLAKQFVPAGNIGASARNQDKLRAFCQPRGVRVCDNKTLIRECPILVVGLKPTMFDEVLPPLVPLMEKHTKLVISIAAGLSLERLSCIFGKQIPLIRTMPNMNARIGQSMTGVCGSGNVSEPDKAYVLELLGCVGQTMIVPEGNFPIFSALAGASPAYSFMFIEALAKAGVKDGMTKADATKAAAQAVLGSAQFLLQQLEEGRHPMALVDGICSPGGTTIAGVTVLEQKAFTGTVMDAALATAQRDRDLFSK